MPERITKQMLRLLSAMAADPTREWYGLELMETTNLKSGTLYPLLHRLVDDGWLVRTRETASEAGGPQRRLYRMTGLGQHAYAERARATHEPQVVLKPTRNPGYSL